MSMDFNYNPNGVRPKEGKSWMTAMLLAWFLGIFGAHRFYTGYTAIGVAQLVLTLSGIGSLFSAIWVLVDIIAIARNTFYDAQGNDLEDANAGCGLIALILIGVSLLLTIVSFIKLFSHI